ncbi:MAG: prepilin-type N-terminal cleavage/methylation domain-containing protein [Candidatus Electrothrix sp. AW1]|nr:prepilin-type N-terminal cleavage/methylation domain-containing protein [Candidatus Electrothrix sp. AX1]MCI5181659.1 prepilin-type N-terminal cleavage/methylation domain-containing protein [Candidatus Electrothrix gigas]
MKMNKLKIQANEKGFTLIELMIVIAIIGILAAVAIPNFIAYRDKAYCSAAEKDANSIAATIADYFAIPGHTTWEHTGGVKLGNATTTFTGGPPTSSEKGLDFSALSGKNYATIGGTVSAIRISVVDGSGRCPTDYMDAQAAAGWVTGLRTFIKKME